MNNSRSTTPLVDISVRNLAGRSWSESWPLEKLAYFILMSEVEPPKFERCLQLEWVQFDSNLYSWDKAALTREQFERLTSQWPRNVPVPFDPGNCDRVQFSYDRGEVGVGVGFNPVKQPALYAIIVRSCQNRITFVEFDYAYARDVFKCMVDEQVAVDLLRPGVARTALGQVHLCL
jgi:hypothetical protein